MNKPEPQPALSRRQLDDALKLYKAAQRDIQMNLMALSMGIDNPQVRKGATKQLIARLRSLVEETTVWGNANIREAYDKGINHGLAKIRSTGKEVSANHLSALHTSSQQQVLDDLTQDAARIGARVLYKVGQYTKANAHQRGRMATMLQQATGQLLEEAEATMLHYAGVAWELGSENVLEEEAPELKVWI